MHAWLALATMFGVGLAYNAAPGPINVGSLRWGSVAGFRAAFLVQVGALIGETLWAALALLGLGALRENGVLHVALALCGVVLLLHMGVAAWRASSAPQAARPSSRSPFLWGAAVSLTNPAPVSFWLAAGAGSLSRPREDPLLTHLGMLLAFVASTLLWAVLAALVAQWSGTVWSAHVQRWLHRGCAAVLVGMSGLACAQLVHLL